VAGYVLKTIFPASALVFLIVLSSRKRWASAAFDNGNTRSILPLADKFQSGNRGPGDGFKALLAAVRVVY
jgi:hypothetical protein